MGRKREKEVARTVALPYDIMLHMQHVRARVRVCMRLMGSRGIMVLITAWRIWRMARLGASDRLAEEAHLTTVTVCPRT